MNLADLEARLKSVRVPERSEEYWNDFPARVRGQLRRRAPATESRVSWLPQLAWGLGAGFVGLVIGLLVLSPPLERASHAIFQKEQFVRQQLAMLPCHLRVLMADEHGLHYLVAEKE
jgi:hypothetical protein